MHGAHDGAHDGAHEGTQVGAHDGVFGGGGGVGAGGVFGLVAGGLGVGALGVGHAVGTQQQTGRQQATHGAAQVVVGAHAAGPQVQWSWPPPQLHDLRASSSHSLITAARLRYALACDLRLFLRPESSSMARADMSHSTADTYPR